MATYSMEQQRKATPIERRRSSFWVDGGDGAKVKRQPSSLSSESSEGGGSVAAEKDNGGGVEPTKRKRPNIKLCDFFDPSKPWVLVEDGSLMGYFDWVPRHLRVGPWNAIAPLYLASLVAATSLLRLHESSVVASPPPPPDRYLLEPFSIPWYYNFLTFFWMLYMHSTFRQAGWFVYCTYTIQSWTMLTIRHGLSALLPLLSRCHFPHLRDLLIRSNDYLRFPSLVTATVTFCVWNGALMPYVALVAMKKDGGERAKFFRWCFNFRMCQVHIANVLYAALNSAVFEDRPFVMTDLHSALSLAIVYGLFYVLVLDRVGCHLYPVFSPRTYAFALTWTALLGCYYASYVGWNRIIRDGSFREVVMGWVNRIEGG